MMDLTRLVLPAQLDPTRQIFRRNTICVDFFRSSMYACVLSAPRWMTSTGMFVNGRPSASSCVHRSVQIRRVGASSQALPLDTNSSHLASHVAGIRVLMSKLSVGAYTRSESLRDPCRAKRVRYCSTRWARSHLQCSSWRIMHKMTPNPEYLQKVIQMPDATKNAIFASPA
jgi:hypothetical protein